jgi:hypothetical protein|tara:strand:- start:625 stop:1098 length:474 start_codon:yes stop_codon:yes gene_type:complete
MSSQEKLMTTERTPRETHQRDSNTRPSDAWNPASILPDPTPQDGWVFRWVRTSIMGQADGTHTSKMFREGWEPCKADDHPELMLQSDINSKFVGNIEVGGLLLCKAPAEKMASRTEHFQKMADNQMDSVDNNYLRENDPRMPLLPPERSTRTTFGRN